MLHPQLSYTFSSIKNIALCYNIYRKGNLAWVLMKMNRDKQCHKTNL